MLTTRAFIKSRNIFVLQREQNSVYDAFDVDGMANGNELSQGDFVWNEN